MEQHLPVLQIVVPLIAAPLCLLIRQRVLVVGLAMTVCWVTFAMSLNLLALVWYKGDIHYALGGWSAPCSRSGFGTHPIIGRGDTPRAAIPGPGRTGNPPSSRPRL